MSDHCYYHPQAAAIKICKACKMSFCPDCIDSTGYCKPCFTKHSAVKNLKQLRQQTQNGTEQLYFKGLVPSTQTDYKPSKPKRKVVTGPLSHPKIPLVSTTTAPANISAPVAISSPTQKNKPKGTISKEVRYEKVIIHSSGWLMPLLVGLTLGILLGLAGPVLWVGIHH
jgi:hypothetical protein